MGLLLFVLKQAWREISFSKQRSLVIILCIAVGISSIAAVQFYATSLRNYFTSNIKELSGGDIVIDPLWPLDDTQAEYLNEKEASGELEYTEVKSSIGIIFSVGAMPRSTMVQIQQVDPAKYPLYGQLKLVGSSDLQEGRTALADGSVLLSSTAMNALGVRPGDKVILGNLELTVGGELESGSIMAGIDNPFFGTALIGTSIPLESEVQSKYLIKLNDPNQLETIAQELWELFKKEVVISENGEKESHDPVSTYTEVNEQIDSTAKILGDSLLVAGLSSLLLGGLGIYSSVTAMIKQRLSNIAVIKCFGGKSRQISVMIGTEILLLTIMGIVLGMLAGIGLSRVIPSVFKDMISIVPDFYVDWAAIGRVGLLGLLTALVFSLIPIIMAVKVKPLVLYRPESHLKKHSTLEILGLMVLVTLLAVLFIWVISIIINSWKASLYFVLALLAIISLAYLPARLLIALVTRFPTGRWLFARLGLRNLNRQGGKATSSVVAIGLGIGAVLLITLFQRDVMHTMEQMISSARSYNVVLVTRSIEKADSIVEHLSRQEYVADFTSVPTIGVSLYGVNNMPPSFSGYTSSVGFRSDFISVAGVRPDDEFLRPYIEQGEWLSGKKGEVVIDSRMAEEMGLKVGDTLQLRTFIQAFETVLVGLSGTKKEDTHANIRLMDQMWMSYDEVKAIGCTGGCSSYVMVRTKDGIPGSVAIGDLRRNFPEEEMIVDLGQIFEVIFKVFNAITAFLQFMGLFSVLSGGVILSGMIISTKYQRRRDIAVIRCFGGNSTTVLASNLFEYGVVGVLAGLMGVVSANGVVKLLVEKAMEREFHFNLPLNAFYVLIAACFTAVIGMFSISDVLKEKPLTVLKYE